MILKHNMVKPKKMKSQKISGKNKMKAGNTTTQQNVMNNLPKDVYDSASEFGVFMALIGLLSAGFFGIIMISVALYLIFNNGTHSAEIDAEVVSSKCNMYKDSKNKVYKKCDTELKYTVDNKEYQNTTSNQKIQLNGSKVKVVYNPSNPNDSMFKTGWRRRSAYILLAIAVFIIIAAGIRYYIVKTFKIAAAASGFGEGAAMAAAPFQYLSSSSSSSSPDSTSFADSPDEMLLFSPVVPDTSSSS
jgi:hypothetical protein